MLSRACWQVALKKNAPLQGQRAGGDPEDHIAGGTEADARPDPKVKGPEAPKLMGEPLTGREGARSLDHRPKDRKSGKYICWDLYHSPRVYLPLLPSRSRSATEMGHA